MWLDGTTEWLVVFDVWCIHIFSTEFLHYSICFVSSDLLGSRAFYITLSALSVEIYAEVVHFTLHYLLCQLRPTPKYGILHYSICFVS